jgi:hypothetical protein
MSDFWWQHVKPAEMLLNHAPADLRQRLLDAHAAAHHTSDSSGDAAQASSADASSQDLMQSDPELAQFMSQLEGFKPSRVHPYAAEIKARSKELLKAAPKRQFSAAETKRAGIAAMDSSIVQQQ